MKKNFPLRRQSRIAYILSYSLAIALLLQACATTTAGPTAGPGNNPTAQVTQPAAQPAAARSGVLRVALQPMVQTDPANISSDTEVLVASHVYDYLVDVDSQNQVQPRLATKWQVSEDGLVYTFTLAEGVTFHDGGAFGAQDVVWTFDRLRDPQLQLPTASLYANIESIEATGDLEVAFKLVKPNPFFLYDLSDNHALILKAQTEDPAKFNGTGPFVVTNYSPEDRIEMKANEKYFLPGQPALAGLEVIFFADETAAVDALRGGQVDVSMRMSTALFESLKSEPDLQTVSIPTNGFDLVRLRSDRAPGNDPKVIQALKLATDRQAIFQLVQQGYGAVGRDSPIGPLYTQYYSEETALPERDIQAARDLLAQAGYADGLKIDLHTPDTGDRPNLAVVLKNQWAEAGIDVNVIVEPESVYYGDNGWLEVDLGITGWGSRPYPQFYLDVMLVCNAEWNESHFCDSEFDELVATAGTTLDEAERVQAYHAIQKILIERGPVIIPYFFAVFASYSNHIQGFQLKAFPGRTDFRTLTISG